jgi:outer membrane protein OmpA-like peptidoglycan-associated protein
MADQDDDVNRRAGLWVVFTVVTLVVLGVLGFAVSRTLATAPAAVASLGEPALRVYFELGSATLPPEASEELARIAEEARRRGARVVVSGYHDASGDPARNAELARERAVVVHHALTANGLTDSQIELRKPAMTTGGTDPREARRVELHLQ